MKLTRAAEYAIRCVLYLSGQPAGRLVSRREVSREMGIPEPFLGKIAQGLAKAGLVIVRQGSRGGYVLALPPQDISLLQVVEALDGEILINDCLSRPGQCERDARCPVHGVWRGVRNGLRQALDRVDFAELARGGDAPAGVAAAATRESEEPAPAPSVRREERPWID